MVKEDIDADKMKKLREKKKKELKAAMQAQGIKPKKTKKKY